MDIRLKYEQKPSKVVLDEGQERIVHRKSNAKRHKRRRKKNYILYYIILLFLLTVSCVTLSLTVLFNISEIKIIGADNMDKEKILSSANVDIGTNLVRLKKSQVVDRIINQNINIDDCTIKKKFPSTLVINIKESEPYLIINSEGSYYTLSKSGRVMNISQQVDSFDIVYIYGLALPPEKLGDFIDLEQDAIANSMKIIDAIHKNKLEKTSKINIKDMTAIKLFYDNRIEIVIGNTRDIDYKLQIANEIIQTKISEQERGVLDVQISGKAYFKEDSDLVFS